MAQPLFASATTAMTGSPQTVVLFTAPAAPAQYEVTDITLENSSATPVVVQLQVNGVTVDQYEVASATPTEVHNLSSKPTALGGQTIGIILPAGTGNITYNVAVQPEFNPGPQ